MSDETSPAAGRRRRFAAKVGPHLQVGEVRTVDVPAQHGVGPHRDFLVMTACGEEKQTTLTTREPERVRCPNCLDAIEREG